jgi:VWFA-related protein
VKRASLFVVLSLCLVPLALAASQTPSSGNDLVSTVVTVINHRSGPMPAISKDDVVVRQDGRVRPVADWQRLAGSQGPIDLAILIDDSLETEVALQWPSIEKFIRQLPQGTRIATVYGTGSRAEIVQPFTTDRELAIKALRLPRGEINAGSSIYLSLDELLKRWPEGNNRGVVLLVSDGIDLFYGVRESNPGQNINLQKAIDLAQKKGVIVDTIFASGAASYSRNFYLVGNGQSCLARLALETGGNSYTAGLQTPINFEPFLNKIADSLAHQFRLTFHARLASKAQFARIQLTTEQRGIELRAPSRVYIPAAR